MLKNSSRNFAALGMIAVATLGLSACGGGSEETDNAGAAPESTTGSESTTTESMAPESGEAMDPAANLVGPACADYAAAVPDGAGSVAGMAKDPVAVAASNNPMLTQLTAAVSGKLNPKVDLVDTLNSGEFTVFAPVDEAFGAIPAETLESLKTDDATLSTILTYHVVEGQLSPDEIVGEHTTVQGESVEVSGSGDELMVNDASVVCGGVQTANATVYMIDSVLMPPAK
ncbi:fasciclin domain-containing protein [Arthrobacter crystallopoietes]|uniref:fasciclin domain-containing protein n=1 Tax=Crystallibacter crystallopoietes TaxID=37928 RepID=UPI0011111651|nr:fasciclin domain-containing protein [Arthrobacter crystallopoietes]QTG82690.1 fasciclin domain-containing protein [Arthrobacter crystallopoietes]